MYGGTGWRYWYWVLCGVFVGVVFGPACSFLLFETSYSWVQMLVSKVALLGPCIIVRVMATTATTSTPTIAPTMISTIAPTQLTVKGGLWSF